MNMFLHDYENAHIERGDTFLEPKHLENGQLKKFDIVLANPPWNQSNWHHEKWKSGDPFNRFTFGLPSKSSGDWAWLQLMYTSLKPGGRMGIVMDNGVLFRGSSEGKIRQQFLEKDFNPIDDMRASSKYRMKVAKNLLFKCFQEIKNKKLIRINA